VIVSGVVEPEQQLFSLAEPKPQCIPVPDPELDRIHPISNEMQKWKNQK
jgi:hypothetical protein